MSFFASGFDAEKVEPNNGFEPIPEGDYRVTITSSVENATKKGGTQIVVEFTVTDGKHYDRRKVWMRYNVKCPTSDTAEKIGQGQLSALLLAIKLPRPGHVKEMLGKSFIATVIVKQDDWKGGLINEVKSYAPIDRPAQSATTTPTATDSQAPDWA